MVCSISGVIAPVGSDAGRLERQPRYVVVEGASRPIRRPIAEFGFPILLADLGEFGVELG
jgi:hypothetical protein